MRVCSIAFVALYLIAGIGVVVNSSAGLGRVGIYADTSGYGCNIVDSTPGLLLLHVVHVEHGGATAIQFSAPLPACMLGSTYLSDSQVFGVTLGNSQTGMASAYGACRTTPVHVVTINVLAGGQSISCCCLWVYPSPGVPQQRILATDCDQKLLYVETVETVVNGNASCPKCLAGPSLFGWGCLNEPSGTKQSTWGQVKALYSVME